jgi:transcription elongation GreA/GreB family factor
MIALQPRRGDKMSRAFVKEQDFDTSADLPDRQISQHPNDVTSEGLAQIDAALMAARAALARSRMTNDRAAAAAASRDLRYWNARRTTARVIPNSRDATRVHFGSVVTIRRDDDREQTFRIVGEDEADPSNGSISYVSPLAKALLGKSVGEEVKAGNHDALIQDIQ